MALALNNMQGELHPLEVGLHAVRSGLKGSEYARRSGIKQPEVARRMYAATVVEKVMPYGITINPELWRSFSEIHAAPKWLWPALVAKLQAESWTIETAMLHN